MAFQLSNSVMNQVGNFYTCRPIHPLEIQLQQYSQPADRKINRGSQLLLEPHLHHHQLEQ